MFMRYVKKPVVVEAVQYNGDGEFTEVPRWLVNTQRTGVIYFDGSIDRCFIKTLEGTMRVSIGDYIIRGVNGELYPCKPDIFEKTYERV